MSRDGRAVLFLDIDGVLNGHEFDAKAESAGLRRDCVDRLNRVLDETGCEVVLSSAWRYMVLGGAMTLSGFGYLLRTHGVRNLGARLVGTTGHDTQTEDPTERGRLVVAWLMGQCGVMRAVVVDDMAVCGEGSAHIPLVQTDGKTGLTDADVDRLIALLGRAS